MFELGLRLAFDKPTIIVKDDKTSYSFDTSAIEHLEYPRDLRFTKIVEFKQKLSDKLRATYEKATTDSSYTTFLKHFGEFTVAKLDKKEVSGQEYILEELKNIRFMMRRLERNQGIRNVDSESSNARSHRITGDLDICMGGRPEDLITEACKLASDHPDVREVLIDDRGPDHKHLIVNLKPGANADLLELEKVLGGKARRRRPPIKSVAEG